MRNFKLTFCLFSAVLAGFIAAAALPESNKNDPGIPFMRAKLTYMQGILEGMTTEKFDLLVTNATLLRDMNLTNSFFKLKNQEYLRNIKQFQGRVDRMIVAGKEQNLTNASECYTQIASACVACHKQFRRDQFVREQLRIAGNPK